MIERSSAEEIKKLNIEANKLHKQMREKTADQRFLITSQNEGPDYYGNDVKTEEDSWQVYKTQGGVYGTLNPKISQGGTNVRDSDLQTEWPQYHTNNAMAVVKDTLSGKPALST